MEGIFDRSGFLVKDPIDFESPPEVIGFRPSSVEGWRLLPSQIGLIVNWSSYGCLSCDWLGGHSGDLG